MTEPYAILVTYVNGLAMQLNRAICEAASRMNKIDLCKLTIICKVRRMVVQHCGLLYAISYKYTIICD
jgi:hypothetical protein